MRVSGSKWLASWLHRHPLVACSHGANGLEAKFGHDFVSRDFPGGEEAYSCYQVGRKTDLPMEEIFREMEEAFPRARVVGNLHMFTINELNARHRQLAASGTVVMNLIRHPVSYMYSLARQLPGWEDRVGKDDEALRKCRALIDHLLLHAGDVVAAEKLGDIVPEIATPREDEWSRCRDAIRLRAFAWMRNMTREAVNYRHVPTITMERMVSDSDYLLEILDRLTGGIVDAAYVRQMIDGGRINDHHREYAVHPANPLAPAEYFATFPDWQQEGFRRIRRNYDFDRHLEALGYRFDFAD